MNSSTMDSSRPNPIFEATLAPAKHILLNGLDALSLGVNNEVMEWHIQDVELSMFTEGYYKIWVNSCQFSNLVYIINQYNNAITIQVNGIFYPMLVLPNNYNGTTIATMLQSLLNGLGLGSSWTVMFDTTSYKLAIQNTGGYSFVFIDVVNSIYARLGIILDGVKYSLYVTPYPIDLLGTSVVDIVTNLQTNIYSTTQVSNYLDRIPITSGFGEKNFYFNYAATSPTMRMTSINYIQIQLRDDRGNPYILPPNSVFTLSIWIQPMIMNSQ